MIRAVVSGSGNMGAQVLATLEAAEDIDPVGIVRGAESEQIIPVPGQVAFVDREEGMRLFNTPLEERIATLAEKVQAR